MFYPRSRSRAFSLVELMVNLTIGGFIVSFLGFLTFMVMRNTAIIHEQVLSQSSAATAGERIAAELRDAKRFAFFPGDNNTTVSRLCYISPLGAGETTQSIVYEPAMRRVKLFANANATGKPKAVYPLISDFEIRWQTEFRVRTTLRFQYSGFALYFNRPNNVQLGQFVTDIIAKNHFMDEGTDNYGQADNPTSSPASL